MRRRSRASPTTARFVLFVTGDAPQSRRARAHLSRALDSLGLDAAAVDEVDALAEPRQAVLHGLASAPALLRTELGGGRRLLYGDLAEAERLQRFLRGDDEAPAGGERPGPPP